MGKEGPHLSKTGESRGLSRVALAKPWVPSTCAGDLSELLRVPLRSQEYCRFGRAFLGRHWVWWNGRGPHLELRRFLSISDSGLRVPAELGQESQASSCFEEWNSACLSSCARVTGQLSSCIWNLRFFPEDATGVSVPLVL